MFLQRLHTDGLLYSHTMFLAVAFRLHCKEVSIRTTASGLK